MLIRVESAIPDKYVWTKQKLFFKESKAILRLNKRYESNESEVRIGGQYMRPSLAITYWRERL